MEGFVGFSLNTHLVRNLELCDMVVVPILSVFQGETGERERTRKHDIKCTQWEGRSHNLVPLKEPVNRSGQFKCKRQIGVAYLQSKHCHDLEASLVSRMRICLKNQTECQKEMNYTKQWCPDSTSP